MDHTIFNERPESQDRLIRQLVKMGYEYIPRAEAEEKRGHLSKVIFEDVLIRFLMKQQYKYGEFYYNFSPDNIKKAVRALDASLLQGLMIASKEIYNYLIDGISLPETLIIDGNNLGLQSFDLHFIDFEHPENNIWQVTEEFSVERNIIGVDGTTSRYVRPDIVLLCNGIPLVVIECKNSAVDVMEGVRQNVRNMQPDYIPQLFKFVQLVLAVNPNKVLYGTCGTGVNYFVEWREQDYDWQQTICERYIDEDKQITTQDRIAVSLLDKKRLLAFVNSFILYDCNIKKIARHQQFFAIEKAMKRIKGEDNKDTKSGVIWHTQGSGKSLTMVMLVKKILADKSIKNPRFILVTDRVNLDKQIRDNFANTAMEPSRASTGKGLKTLILDKGKTVITTLIHKFETVVKMGVESPDSENIFLFIDEAHRSNYSSMYNYMRSTLPYSTFIAFTGTPLLGNHAKNIKKKGATKRDTYAKFGPLIDSYTMKKAIEDNITVPLVYEGRKVEQQEPAKKIDFYFERLIDGLNDVLKEELRQKWSRYKPIAETSSRLNVIAFDVADHFKSYCLPKKLKAMLVCSSRAACCEVFDVLKEIEGIKPAVVISFDKEEGEDDDKSEVAKEKIKRYYSKYVKPLFGDNVEAYDDSITSRFKGEEDDVDDINMLIVKDKLLTGFDAPIAGVLYVDKSLQQHNLLQAIARVNRVYKGKDFGLIVDYYGIFSKLTVAMDMYDDETSGFNAFDKEDLEDAIFGPIDEKNKLEKAYQDVVAIFKGLKKTDSSNAWQEYLSDESSEKIKRRNEFFEKLAKFAKLLDFALSNRSVFMEVGVQRLNDLKSEYLFYRKLKDAAMKRYNDSVQLNKYEEGIKNLLNSFVLATDVKTVIEPVSIFDVDKMQSLLDEQESFAAKADTIKTRAVSELKQKRYDDPLLFEEFSLRIKKTLDKYAEDRDADSYLRNMEIIADDLRNQRVSKSYPAIIKEDSDAKAFYGAIITPLKEIKSHLTFEEEEIIGRSSLLIKDVIKNNTKRDWKHNTVIHKAIHRELDDCIFDLFDELNIDCNVEANVDVLDKIIEEIMKVALTRF